MLEIGVKIGIYHVTRSHRRDAADHSRYSSQVKRLCRFHDDYASGHADIRRDSIARWAPLLTISSSGRRHVDSALPFTAARCLATGRLFIILIAAGHYGLYF